MPLAATAQHFLDVAAEGPDLHQLAPEQARAAIAALTPAFGIGDPVERIEDLEVPGPVGPVPVRLYHPGGSRRLPLLVYLHGGGWMLGGIPFADSLCRKLAARGNCVVVSIDYPLAPEHPYPAAVDAGYAVLSWAAAHASELGADSGRIAIGGDSAGGNLAAVLAQLARDRGGPSLAFQLLLFPSTDLTLDFDSIDKLADGYFLTRDAIRHFIAQYAGDHDIATPALSPLRADDHAQLPPAFIVTAEFDPLRDDAAAYTAALHAAGVPATLEDFDGQIHSFLVLGDLFAADANAAVDKVAAALRGALSPVQPPATGLTFPLDALPHGVGDAAVVFFYPKAGSQVCSAETRAFELAYDKFVEADIALFGMSTDDGETQSEFAATCGARFPLVSDVGATTARALGLLKHYDGHGDFADRVTLLLDGEGTVRQTWQVGEVAGHPEEVLAAAKALKNTRP